jgi:hypothetical protein
MGILLLIRFTLFLGCFIIPPFFGVVLGGIVGALSASGVKEKPLVNTITMIIGAVAGGLLAFVGAVRLNSTFWWEFWNNQWPY